MPDWLNPYRWLLAGGLIAAAALGFTVWKHNLISEAERAGYDKAVAEARERELQAVKAARAEEQRRTQAVQGVANATRKELATARAAADDARRAGELLRAQLAAAGALCGGPANPAAAGGSPATNPAGGLLADVQRRLDEAADATLRFADESRIAGLGCERAYETLTP